MQDTENNFKTSFTLDEIIENRVCYSVKQIKALATGKDSYDLIEDILLSSIPLKDRLWFLMRKTNLSLLQKRQLALVCAKSVLAVFEAKYPSDMRPRQAIELAEASLNGDEVSEKALNAAIAAYEAASAAFYAYDPAAAYDPADAASDAAYAYASAAYAYAASDAAYAATAGKQDTLLKNVIDLVKSYYK